MRLRSLSAAIALGLLGTSPTALADVWRIENVPANQRAAVLSQASRSYVYGDTLWYEAESAPKLPVGARIERVIDAGRVRVGSFDFDPISEASRAAVQPFSTTATGHGLRLVQLHAPAQEGWLESLQSLGMKVLQYYPHQTYLVWADASAVSRAGSIEFVRWQGNFGQFYKINADLAQREGLINNVQIEFYNDTNPAEVLDWLKSIGADVVSHGKAQPDGAFWDAWVKVDASTLQTIAAHPQVLWLGYASPKRGLDDEMSDQIQVGNFNASNVPQVGYLPWLLDFGFEGNGVTWAIVDTGVDRSHPDLLPNLGAGFTTADCTGTGGDDSSGGGHGTHVGGIVAGLGLGDGAGGDAEADANGFLYGLGVAPSATLYPIVSGCSAWPPAGGWQLHSKLAIAGGAVGMNASWTSGEGTAHGYQASERTHDLMVRDGDFDTPAAEPFVVVFSAGNSGPGASTLTAPKEAKNPIVTASGVNFRAGSIDAISGFSSRGPAVDGRLGPTIAAPGESIASTKRIAGASSCATSIAGTGNRYALCSGTSMAAPHVSGAVVQLTDWWRTQNAGATPSPAMLKALLVNGAVDMGTADIPNANEGWGRVLTPSSMGEGVLREYRDQSTVFNATGEQQEITVGIPDPLQPLKITLVWTDAAGAVGANPALVNNLDLEVTTGGSTYRGNVFAAGVSTTGGSADTRNNTEQVLVPAPGGDATITIKATAINGDGVPGGDSTDQDFALVCSNCAEAASFGLSTDVVSQSVCAPAAASFDVDLSSILGFSESVTLSLPDAPANATVTFGANPLTPPDGTSLIIGNTSAVAPGSYSMTLTGTAASVTKTRPLSLSLFNAAPSTANLLLPNNLASNQSATPSFDWADASQAQSYLIEIDDNADFSSPTLSATVNNSAYTATSALATSTTYYWRVTAANTCGSSNVSPVFSFTTEAAPGDCNLGDQVQTAFGEDFETGAVGWSSTGTGNTWAQSGSRVNSGSFSWKATDPDSASDQQLKSPAISLPGGQSPLTLQFFHYRDIEERSAGGCYDAGVIEVSTNGGGNWSAIPDAALLTDPYNGAIQSGNVLVGRNGWCNLKNWTRSVVNLDAYAGQEVSFRFRLTSDGSVGAEGWYIDDVRVQSCTAPLSPDLIFRNGFE
ncbi:MAG: S8 family serine peptidase [Lysobacteraceae bacterium]